MAQDNMILFAKKLKLESRWNELFLENRGQITAEMSVLGDEIKQVIRSIIRETRSRSPYESVRWRSSSLRWLIRTYK
jgi:hypothetical protein